MKPLFFHDATSCALRTIGSGRSRLGLKVIPFDRPLMFRTQLRPVSPKLDATNFDLGSLAETRSR